MVFKKIIGFTLFLLAPVAAYYGIVHVMPYVLDYSPVLSSIIFSLSLSAIVYFALTALMISIAGCYYFVTKIGRILHELTSFSARRSQNIRVVSRF